MPHELTPFKVISNDEIIDRIADGEYGAHIAKNLGVTKQTLQARVSKHPGYKQARETGCEIRIDATMSQFDALQVPRPPLKPRKLGDTDEDKAAYSVAMEQYDAEVADWKNGLRLAHADLARVDALFRAVTWQAEREFPARWGKQNDISININQMVTIDGALSTAASSLLDQLRTVAEVPKDEPESVQNPEQLE